MSFIRTLSVGLVLSAVGLIAGCGATSESADQAASSSEAVLACPVTKPVQASACGAYQVCTYKNVTGIPTSCSCYPNGRSAPEWHCIGTP